MRKFRFVFMLATLIIVWSVATPAFGQAKPFIKRPASQAEIVKAIDNCEGLLNIDCKTLAKVADATYREKLRGNDLDISTPGALADYVETLVPVPCPKVDREVVLGRILKTGVVDLKGFKRKFKPNEMCLFDNQLAYYFAPLTCFNFIPLTEELPMPDIPLRSISVSVASPARSLVTPGKKPAVTFKPTDVRAEEVQVARHEEPEIVQMPDGRVLAIQPKKSWWSRNWKWVAPVAAIGIGATVCASVCNRTDTVTVTVNIR